MKADPKQFDEDPGRGVAEYLADCYLQIAELEDVDEIKRILRERLYALRLSQDPLFKESAKEAAREIAAGHAGRGAMSIAEVAVLRERAT